MYRCTIALYLCRVSGLCIYNYIRFMLEWRVCTRDVLSDAHHRQRRVDLIIFVFRNTQCVDRYAVDLIVCVCAYRFFSQPSGRDCTHDIRMRHVRAIRTMRNSSSSTRLAAGSTFMNICTE